MKQRIEFKIALLVFKAVSGLSPVYLSNLLQIQPTRSYNPRSDDKELRPIYSKRLTIDQAVYVFSFLLCS